MLEMQKRLARMQAELDSLTTDVASCSKQQGHLHENLNSAQSGIGELLDEEARASGAVADAKAEVAQASLDLESATTEVWRSLSRPAPFLAAGAPPLPLPLPGPAGRCAVVSTLRGIAEPELMTWLSHHLDGCGFSLAYLFFDDPAELAVRREVLEIWAGRAQAVPVDGALEAEYATCRRFEALQGRLEEDWLARQELHVELAMRKARDKNCQWLLHIDLDELFMLQDRTAPQHFAAMSADQSAVAYLNHEGVPELDDHATARLLHQNRFEAVSLFRRNPLCFAEGGFGLDGVVLSAEGLDLTKTRLSAWQRRLNDLVESTSIGTDAPRSPRSASARRAFIFWARRTKEVLGNAQYFLAYANGKGAVRLDSDELPNGVHRFGTENLGVYWSPEEASVLHYANGAFEAVAEKLRRLRASSGAWWRSFVLYASGRDLDDASLRSVYAGAVALCDAEEAKRQVETRVCLRYHVADRHLPRWLLGAMD